MQNADCKEQVAGEDSVFDSVSTNLRDMEHFLVDSIEQLNETILAGYIYVLLVMCLPSYSGCRKTAWK